MHRSTMPQLPSPRLQTDAGLTIDIFLTIRKVTRGHRVHLRIRFSKTGYLEVTSRYQEVEMKWRYAALLALPLMLIAYGAAKHTQNDSASQFLGSAESNSHKMVR